MTLWPHPGTLPHLSPSISVCPRARARPQGTASGNSWEDLSAGIPLSTSYSTLSPSGLSSFTRPSPFTHSALWSHVSCLQPTWAFKTGMLPDTGSKEALQGGNFPRCSTYQPSLDGAEWSKDLGHPPAKLGRSRGRNGRTHKACLELCPVKRSTRYLK